MSYLFICLLAFLCGTMISNQMHFFVVFEGELFLDWVILTGIMLIAVVLGHLYLRIKPFTLIAFQICVLCLSAIAYELSFMAYGTVQIASFTPYIIILAAGIVLGVSLNVIRKKGYERYLVAGALLVMGMVSQKYQTDRSWNIYLMIFALIALFIQNYRTIERNYALLFILFLPVVVISIIYNNTAITNLSQYRYYDKVVYSKSTPFQQIDITLWKGNYWFYYNNINQFSSIDEWLYTEPMVHPVMELSESDKMVLVIGGENGIVAREILKHDVDTLDIIPIDFSLIQVASSNQFFTKINKNALLRNKVKIRYANAFRYLYTNEDRYDVILIDVSDPLDLELNQYYSKEFYELCFRSLHKNGFLVTQGGSPYFATKAFTAIENTISASNFTTIPLHNQVLSLGEWGWIIGSKNMNKKNLLSKAKLLKFNHIDTRWINNEAMQLLMSFGKPYLIADSIAINSIKNPVIHSYYKSGTWKF